MGKITPIPCWLFQKTKKEKIPLNYFYEASISLLPKVDITRKQNTISHDYSYKNSIIKKTVTDLANTFLNNNNK